MTSHLGIITDVQEQVCFKISISLRIFEAIDSLYFLEGQ
jgi:hypothetical protein